MLIIDDQIYNLLALKGMVKKQGFDSDKCLSGKEAIKLIEHRIACHVKVYKLVMLDYSMPELDGPQTAIRIRQVCRDANVDQPYICCVTAYSEAHYKRSAKEAGMNKLMVKPLQYKQISQLLRKAKLAL